MAKKIMIQGTMSNSGKSFLVAALCRIFHQDGYRVAPFKSQNMALNSFITADGLEIGRAQAMQAEAAGIAPTVDMNPILLKPTSQMGSQVIVNGEVYGNLNAMEYYRRKPEFIPVIREAFARLEEQYDIIVLEGAGSPAEINLRDNDIVNMGMAELVDAPVLLVGDIDRGGVFASLYGTVSLLEAREQQRIQGLLINKFRGDVKILEPGLRMIEERLGIPVLGVIPMGQIDLDDEDSLSERLNASGGACAGKEQSGPMGRSASTETTVSGNCDAAEPYRPCLDIAVIHLPYISNFTDFNILQQNPGVSLRYVKRASQLGTPDLLILPGTKNTMADLTWLRESGLEPAVLRLVEESRIPIIGICGGYQMLGTCLRDPDGVEGRAGVVMRGMELLPAETVFAPQKTRTQIQGTVLGGQVGHEAERTGWCAACCGMQVTGYEIHMGRTELLSEQSVASPAIQLADGRADGLIRDDDLVFGSYLHGLFDNEALTKQLLTYLAAKKGIRLDVQEESRAAYKERQYDKLADLVREALDMDAIYEILR